MSKSKIDWEKIWEEFDGWRMDCIRTGKEYVLAPEQQTICREEIQSLVEKQLKNKAGQSKPVFGKKD